MTEPLHGATETFKLGSPIATSDGKTIKQLKIREPLLRDRLAAERKYPTSNAQKTIFLVSRLADISEDEAGKLKTWDARKIEQWIQGLAQFAQARDIILAANTDLLPLVNAVAITKAAISIGKHSDDVLREIVARADSRVSEAATEEIDACDEFVPEYGSRRTFDLIAPVPTDSEPLASLTIDEPDLGSAVAVERFDTDAERLAGLIAQLGKTTIPIALRLTTRDADRIEAHILPFLINDAPSKTETIDN